MGLFNTHLDVIFTYLVMVHILFFILVVVFAPILTGGGVTLIYFWCFHTLWRQCCLKFLVLLIHKFTRAHPPVPSPHPSYSSSSDSTSFSFLLLHTWWCSGLISRSVLRDHSQMYSWDNMWCQDHAGIGQWQGRSHYFCTICLAIEYHLICLLTY